MSLAAHAAKLRLEIFEELKLGRMPTQGTFDRTRLAEALAKGPPRMGPTRYEPWSIVVEFFFAEPGSDTMVVPIRLEPPERIVFLAVPPWVLESIWQGHVEGSFHFESDALALVAEFSKTLEPEPNGALFGPRAPTRRE